MACTARLRCVLQGRRGPRMTLSVLGGVSPADELTLRTLHEYSPTHAKERAACIAFRPSDALPCRLTFHHVQGYISSADYSGKKTHMVLFINGRSGEHVPSGPAVW